MMMARACVRRRPDMSRHLSSGQVPTAVMLSVRLLVISMLLLGCGRTASAYSVLALKSADIRPYDTAVEGFRSTCNCSVTEVDYSELRDIDLAAEVRLENPSLVLAVGLDAVRGAARIKERPVVYTMIANPPHLPASASNISGVSMNLSPSKYLAAIKDVFPNVRRIGILYNPSTEKGFVDEVISLAQSRHLTIVAEQVTNAASAPALINSMKGRIDLYWMIPDSTIVNSETVNFLLLFSFQNKIPLFSFSRKYVEMGATAGLTISPFDMGAEAGDIARRVLSPSFSGPLRLETSKSVITINMKIVSKFGLKVRESVLQKADRVD